MQRSSILCCSSNFPSPSIFFSTSQLCTFLPGKQINSGDKLLISSKLPLTSLHTRRPCRLIVRSASTPTQELTDTTSSTQELTETTSPTSDFVKVGYIFGVHGFHGEVRVRATTEFPELRLSQPGTRWLKQQLSGTETFQEVELVEGRGHPGQSWIVKFNNINTVEQARLLVGSTIMVTDEDRPDLEEGEFYTNDLIGMRVILKESGEQIGSVVNVINTGASDILQVKLTSFRSGPGQIAKSNVVGGDSGPLVWVPFVEAIVPIVDLEKREMLITPPKGLLELNIRSHERSKKERRVLEWKERRKFQRRLIAAKKKLTEMEQQHVFYGFRFGEKDQKSLLANQIVTANSKLLQQALQSIEIPYTRPDLQHILSELPRSNTLRLSNNASGSGKISERHNKLQSEGFLLTCNGKVALVLVLEEIDRIENISVTSLVNSEGNTDACLLVKALLDDHEGFVKIEERSAVPLILVTSAGSVSSLQELFSDNDYFAFDPEKVWFLEEAQLPVVSSFVEENAKHKILMKSPWEFLQRPIGSGGVISLLSSQDSLLDQLSETGVEYFEVSKVNPRQDNDHALIGLVDSCKANVGIRLFKGTTSDEDFNVVLSMHFLRKVVKQINKLQFQAVASCNPYVEKVDKDWIDVVPSSPNSYEFRSSIYSCLNAAPIKKVCILDLVE